MDSRRIKKVVISYQGCVNTHVVGEDGITDIRIWCRQISEDGRISIIEILNGDDVVEEISMSIPYILTYFKNK